ncbi:MAG: hypothetical protein LAO21_14170 [Acidobacteriia bacterium]|nr:hypothetical protein [Terriglobia bacterium]
METLFVMFLMFMIIAAIYQLFIVHNTFFQMTANAYYDAFKESRDQNKKDNSFTLSSSDLEKPLTLTNGMSGGDNKTIPLIPFFKGSLSGVSMRVSRNFHLSRGTGGGALPDFGTTFRDASNNAQGQGTPCTGSCDCVIGHDGDGNPVTTMQMQMRAIMHDPFSEPKFPHISCVGAQAGPQPGGGYCPTTILGGVAPWGLTATCSP